MRYVQLANSQTENITEITRSWREEGMRSYCLMSTEFLFEMMKKFQQWTMVMVAHHCEVLNATELYT